MQWRAKKWHGLKESHIVKTEIGERHDAVGTPRIDHLSYELRISFFLHTTNHLHLGGGTENCRPCLHVSTIVNVVFDSVDTLRPR